MNVNDEVCVYDIDRESIYNCTIYDIIKTKSGEVIFYLLSPHNPHLPKHIKLEPKYVFETFAEAFVCAMELDD